MEKEKIKELVLDNLIKTREELAKSYESYKDAAREAPGAMQSHSDTSKFQSNILAENIAQQLSLFDRAIKTIKECIHKNGDVGVGALIKIKENGEIKYFYFVPEGVGGFRLEDGGNNVQVVAINTPIGKNLFGKVPGDKIEMNLPVGKKSVEVLGVN